MANNITYIAYRTRGCFGSMEYWTGRVWTEDQKRVKVYDRMKEITDTLGSPERKGYNISKRRTN